MFHPRILQVEDAYEKKFKESLPPDWVDQLKGTVITIAKE